MFVKIRLITLLFILSFAVSAKEFSIYSNGTYEKIKLIQSDNTWMSVDCSQNKTDCPFYKSLPDVIKKNSVLAGHPAAHYCSQLKGQVTILKDSDNNAWDFCSFQNGKYLIDSWGLYDKRNWGLFSQKTKECSGEDGKLSMSFKELSVTKAYQLLSEFADLQLRIDKNLPYVTQFNFSCLHWKDVAQNIADKYKLTIKTDNNTLTVKNPLSKEQ